MRLNPYGEDPVRFGLDLLERPPTSPDQLRTRCLEAGVAVAGHRRVTKVDVATVEAFLGRWAEVVDEQAETTRAELLNDLLATTAAYPRLTNHVGDGWHLHYRAPELPVGEVVAALVAVGTALHLTGRGMHRLGRCAAPACDRAFGDFSRTGRQRYCGTACSNRDAVRRHRERARATT
ncbi:MAG: CGNR zinc finger domain-containing protein [Actinomycetota bacterium]|nr:CGNR zinc finger domain-containing protein [Actinomycetota bacterium]